MTLTIRRLDLTPAERRAAVRGNATLDVSYR